MKNKRNVILIIILIVVFISGLFVFLKFGNNDNTSVKKNEEKELKKIDWINGIDVVTKNNADIYKIDNNDYVKVGSISREKYIKLVGTDIIDEEYLLIDEFDKEYYVSAYDVENTDTVEQIDYRYKEYIVFNENVITEGETNFYDYNGELVYTFKFGVSVPIIIKDTDRYGVEYNNRLLYIKSSEVKDVVYSNNTDVDNIDGIRVLNYHSFYDDNTTSKCSSIICSSDKQFRTHLDYLRDSDILTLKMNEVEMYIDGKIRLPRSVLITIDDGWLAEVGINLLNEYKMYGTIFLITYLYAPKDFQSEYVETHSHGNDLHNQGVCPGGQGGAIKCLPKDELLSDLEISRNKLDGSKAFAYPFYEFNNYSISVLKEAGFTMAFAGQGMTDDNLIHVGMDKFRLPRYVIYNYTTVDNLRAYIF